MSHGRKRAAHAVSGICVSGMKRFPNARSVASALVAKKEQLSEIASKYDGVAAVVRLVDKQGAYIAKPYPGTKTMDIKAAAGHLQEEIEQTAKRIGSAHDLFDPVVAVTRNERGLPVGLAQPRDAKKLLGLEVKRRREAVALRFLDPLEWARAARSAAWGAGQLDRMEGELARLLDEYRPTGRGQAEVDRVLRRIRDMLQGMSRGGSIELVLFGSRGYGICNDASDIDVMITSRHANVEKNKAEVKRALREVSSGLRSMRGFRNIVNISSTRVPIVKFKYSGSMPELQFEGDISCSNAIALKKTGLIKRYVDLDQRVRSVFTALKKWAKMRQISDSNTLNSYGLMMMALAFLINRRVVPPLQLLLTADVGDRCWAALADLQTSPARIQATYWRPGAVVKPSDPARCLETGNGLPVHEMGGVNTYYCNAGTAAEWQRRSPNKSTASQLLFEFFHFYGFSFDPLTQAVSPRLGSPAVPRAYLTRLEAPACQKYLAEPKQWGQKLRLLAIEDPFETSLNCGRNAPAEWVEGLLWEMRRAATILAPGHQDSRHGVFEKLLLPPASCIYGEPASWASVYDLLMPHMRRTCAAADGNGLFDPDVDLLPESLVDAGALESAQLEEGAEHGMPSSSNRNNRSSSSSSRPRNRQRRKGPLSGPSPAIAAAPIPDAEARADRRS